MFGVQVFKRFRLVGLTWEVPVLVVTFWPQLRAMSCVSRVQIKVNCDWTKPREHQLSSGNLRFVYLSKSIVSVRISSFYNCVAPFS